MWIIKALMDNFDPMMFAVMMDGDGGGGDGDGDGGDVGDTGGDTGDTGGQPFNWKGSLEPDIQNSPLVQKFNDNPEGLNNILKAHANLERLLGHEKVPIPKDDNDVEGWQRFSKAMGIPDQAEKYGLADPELPENMKDEFNFDKKQFSEVAHSLRLTPNQTKALWETYTSQAIQARNAEVKAYQDQMVKTVNELRGKWGDAYDHNVQLGQMVINKFSGGNKDVENFLTTALARDPKGVEFLSRIGSQFAENKIGEFSATRFTQSPDQAQAEYEKIMNDPKHPYMNPDATIQEHDQAVAYVNRLLSIINKRR